MKLSDRVIERIISYQTNMHAFVGDKTTIGMFEDFLKGLDLVPDGDSQGKLISVSERVAEFSLPKEDDL